MRWLLCVSYWLITLKLVMQQLLEALDTAHATGIGALLSACLASVWGHEGLPCVSSDEARVDNRIAVCCVVGLV
jgi:hypothetical protein